MTHKIVFLFSGQGSQYQKMGKDLFLNNSVFKESITESDLIIRKHLDRSLVDELYYSDDTNFSELLIAHPSITAIEVAMIKVMQDCGITPDYVFGQSFGEFATSVASGICSTTNTLKVAYTLLWNIKESLSKIIKTGLMIDFKILELESIELENGYHVGYFKNFPQYKSVSLIINS